MAKTLLDGVNEVLKRVSVIGGDTSALTSLTSAAQQVNVNIAVQTINEGVDDLYISSNVAKPLGQGEATLTLSLGVRDYALDADLVRLRWPMVDKSNSQFLFQYPGGYNAMLIGDPEQDDTGLPYYGAISPVSGELHLDRSPTSEEAGRVYTYQFDKDLALVDASDTMPFKDIVFRALVPCWVQLWKRERRNEFDGDLYRINVGRAAALLTQIQPRDSYSPR